MNYTVNENCPRLDKYVASLLDLSRDKIKKLLKSGHITVNKKIPKASQSLTSGDSIEIKELIKETPLEQEKITYIDSLYEDDSILVINKPKNCIVHPGDGQRLDTLVDYLKREGVSLASDAGEHRPGIVHRLDRNTEGLLVIAKTNEAYHHLKQQFQKREVVKKYVALVHGNLLNDHKELNYPIARHPSKRHLMCVLKEGKEACTRYSVLKRFNSKTLVDIELLTGRTHQIRVHFSYIGNPLIHDKDYGSKTNGKGQCLQSYFLSFIHPKTHKKITVTIPKSNFLNE
jgi:23S rRNA pseudouridine1911/1915/1917 synthase